MSFVQGITGEAVAQNGTLVLPGNTVAGNTIIVMAVWSYSGTNLTITDSQGNTYTEHGPRPEIEVGYLLYVFSAPVGSSAANTLTVHGAVGSCRVIVAVEVSGLAASPFDQFNSNANATTSLTTGSITTTAAGEYLAALFMRVNASSGGYTAGSAITFTKRFEWAGDNTKACYEDGVQAGAGAVNPDATCVTTPGTYHVLGFTASFKAAAGGTILRGGLTIP